MKRLGRSWGHRSWHVVEGCRGITTHIILRQQVEGAEDLIVLELEAPCSLKVSAEVCNVDGLNNLLSADLLDLSVRPSRATTVVLLMGVVVVHVLQVIVPPLVVEAIGHD